MYDNRLQCGVKMFAVRISVLSLFTQTFFAIVQKLMNESCVIHPTCLANELLKILALH